MDNNYNNQNNGPSSNNTVIIAVVALIAAIIIAIIIMVTLVFTGVIQRNESTGVTGGNITTVSGTQTMYVVENAYVRSEPNDTSTILITLSPGAPVTYKKDANSTYAAITYTSSDGTFEGYVEKSILSATKPEIKETTTMYIANVKHSVYFRSEPVENSGNIITEILLRTPVTFIENANSVFAKISYNGQEGYVKREYLSTSMPAAAPSTPAPSAYDGNTTVSGYRFVANVKNSIYFRSQPVENSGNIICEIPLATEVGFIETTNSTFSKITYNGKIGYAKSEYLSTTRPGGSAKATTTMTVCNVKHSIYLRSAPKEVSNNIITEIPVGSTVEYLGGGNDGFLYIRWNGYTGYAKSQYLR